jgi:hypothetical protein
MSTIIANPNNVFKECWPSLSQAVDSVFRSKPEEVSFEVTYRLAYNLVLQRQGAPLFENLETCFQEHLKKAVVDVVVYSGDESFLVQLGKQWDIFKLATIRVKQLFDYLDSNFVPQTTQRRSLMEMGTYWFKKIVLVEAGQGNRAQNAILSVIQQERKSGSFQDVALMKQAVRVLYETKSYEEFLEDELLRQTRDHYNLLGAELCSKLSVPEYLEKAHGKVQEENSRVAAYLQEVTRKKFEEILRDELVEKHMNFIIESNNKGFQSLVNNDRYEDLSRMFDLFSFHTAHLEVLRMNFKQYCLETGKSLIGDAELAQQKPIEYIQQLFELKQKYDRIVEKAFKGDKDFMRSLNEATEASVNVFPRFSEFLSKFIDYLIRNITNFDKQTEESLERGMVFFRMLADKDVFEANYKIELSRRLLMGKDDMETSRKAEKFFIVRLKSEMGHQFTSKMEGMLNDMVSSQNTLREFHKSKPFKSLSSYASVSPEAASLFGSVKTNSSAVGGAAPGFSVNVLTTNMWPSFMVSTPHLPIAMDKCLQAFTQFYGDEYPGRKLSWQPSIGGGIVQGLFPLMTESRVDIHCSTYQMMILSLLNEDPALTFSALIEKTKVNEKDLKKNLLVMYAGAHRILNKTGDPKDIADSDTFTINLYFKAEKYSIKLGGEKKYSVGATVLPKQQQQAGDDGTSTFAIPQDHVIVKVLKSQKTGSGLTLNEILSRINNVENTGGGQKEITEDVLKAKLDDMIAKDLIKLSPGTLHYVLVHHL